MKLKSTYYICEFKCLIQIYINCASEFDRGLGPLSSTSVYLKMLTQHILNLSATSRAEINALLESHYE